VKVEELLEKPWKNVNNQVAMHIVLLYF